MSNRPIVVVRKQLLREHPSPRVAAIESQAYVGPHLQRREFTALQRESDVFLAIRARWSDDNGRTWTDFVNVQNSTLVKYGEVTVSEWAGALQFHPTAGVLVQLWLRQIEIGGIFHNFTYSRFSRDQGRTWSAPQMLRYQDGAEFDPADPANPNFLNHNEGYPGNNIVVQTDGTLIVCIAHSNAANDPQNNERPWRMGSSLFIGRWSVEKGDYHWAAAARTEISPEFSARGLMEPEVAELTDGRLLVVWRGSTQGTDNSITKFPGRKFFSLSSDRGQTLTPPKEWKYEDGSSFYSPSSYHTMFRHSISGKLYWLGNITAGPPEGNSPRYPLVIAEIDEPTASIKKSTVTVIDDRGPDQGVDIQFSNFSLLEDRETHRVELYLTTLGQELDRANWATADAYKYVLSIEGGR